MDSDLQQVKEKLRTAWMAGDFGKIALFSEVGAADFVTKLEIPRGARVLDVACGTGNLAIPAAVGGAVVTGIDLVPNVLEQARVRASAAGVTATFQEADAESLPFPDASFDVVMTMFGAMFAPRPEVVASELARVCRPGGLIAMANWTPAGFVGKSFRVSSQFAPPPPGIPAPVLWGEDAVVRDRLGPYCSNIETEPAEIVFDYPFPPAEVVQHFRRYFGPTQVAFARLDETGQAALAQALEQMWREHNQAPDGNCRIAAEYLMVRATR